MEDFNKLFLATVARRKKNSELVSRLETFLRIGHGS